MNHRTVPQLLAAALLFGVGLPCGSAVAFAATPGVLGPDDKPTFPDAPAGFDVKREGIAKASQSYFGLTPQQAALTGLPVYFSGAGLRFAAIGIVGSVDVSTHWLILWGAACSGRPARRAIRPSCRTARTGTLMPGRPIAFERWEPDRPSSRTMPVPRRAIDFAAGRDQRSREGG